ncbi:MAG: EAL domain-containing protein [Thermodesulfovibrio sp.]|nr:EAL domain-containing protein [Thermodesulfovibrio sp.]MDW7998175.1 EAL domain-containing protein [Thermodesulfovibrio sp.]
MLQTEHSVDNHKSIESLYSELTVYFQPIFSSKEGKIFGYESLTRHKSKDLNIKNLFLEAKKNGSIFILDMIARRNSIKEASRQNLESYLFINICPETLFYPQHEIGITDKFAEEFNFPKERIVLEITEQSAIENYKIFMKSVSYYKSRGYKIAIDDFGAGFGGPKLLSLLEPDIVKIDKHFIHTFEENNFSKSFIEFVVTACHKLNIMVVAEGIETSYQLSEVVKIGVDLLQGFYLGKPEEKIKKIQNVSR